MKLTIIVPVYKVEPYLRKCIDSILAQTFTDFELILVDDGSPDGCPAICDEYAEKDSRIIVIHKENGGLSSARNAGLDIAKGEYIGFVDSDDWIHPQMYEKMLSKAVFQLDIIACNIMLYDCKTQKSYSRRDLRKDITYAGDEILDQYFYEVRDNIFTSACNKIIKKEILQNIRFPKGRIYEDESIILEILSKCKNIYVCREPLYCYCINRNDSILTSEFSHKRFDLLIMAKEQCDFFERRNDSGQTHIAYSFYNKYYMWNYFAVHCRYPQYKKEFKEYEKVHCRNIARVIDIPDMCRMKFFVMILMYIVPKISYRLCRKYFPECLYEFMR